VINQGDRAGICVTQFDAHLLERGLVSSPGLLPTAYAIIIALKKIRFFKGEIVSGAKFHVSIGHSTILSTITLFNTEIIDEKKFSYDDQYSYLQSLGEENEAFALLEFDHPLVIALNSKVLGSKLDTDVHTTSCRLAFEGHLEVALTSEKYKTEDLNRLQVFKIKEKSGLIERANNEMELIGKNMFKKETNIHLFDGFKVKLSSGQTGVMDGPFGQSGKFKVRLDQPLNEEVKNLISNKKKKGGISNAAATDENAKIEVKMTFKKFIFSKKMAQS
jgi:selenocysteine-specific elongation factor